jgi:hypothetical protein
LSFTIYTQEIDEFPDDFYYDFGMGEGITIFGERPVEYPPDSIESYVLSLVNGIESNRKQFIQTDFLEEAGFRRTGNVRYRQTTGSEKASSILYGIAHVFTLGIVPMRPFTEIEYGRLPNGQYYDFNLIISSSRFRYASPEVLIIIELEYKLQIEFCFGIVIQDNQNYYTEENINRFEELIMRLPEYPESILSARNRFINELQKIKAAYERWRNPSEDQIRAIQNLNERTNLENIIREESRRN